jgi:hypothetical protein
MTEMWTVVKNERFMPRVLIVIDVLAAARYGVGGDWGRVTYWACAAGITFAATWMMR